ncbi:Rhodopsin 7 [Carabus blaptoides fortunei]
MSLLGITSITTLTVLAFERYVMVSKPFNSHHLTKRTAVFIVVGIWIYSFALTIPPLFGWSDYVNEAANISCSVNWQEQTFNTTTYIVFLFFFGLIVPVGIIFFSYVNIIRTMKQNTFRIGRVNKLEGRVTYMVALMIIAFLVAWTPYAVLALLVQFGDPGSVSPAMAVVPALVAKSSICYNPLIYVGLNTQFRSSWKHLFGISDVAGNSLVENENTMGATKIMSQMTQDSIDDKKKYQLIRLNDSPILLKPFQPQKLLLMKSSQSDGVLNSGTNFNVTLANGRGKLQTKRSHNSMIHFLHVVYAERLLKSLPVSDIVQCESVPAKAGFC